MSACCKICHEINCECDENVLDYKKRVEVALKWAFVGCLEAADMMENEWSHDEEAEEIREQVKDYRKEFDL